MSNDTLNLKFCIDLACLYKLSFKKNYVKSVDAQTKIKLKIQRFTKNTNESLNIYCTLVQVYEKFKDSLDTLKFTYKFKDFHYMPPFGRVKMCNLNQKTKDMHRMLQVISS